MNSTRLFASLLYLCLIAPITYAQEAPTPLVHIHTRLHSFIGKPSWLLVIRDLDHNQNLPYVFDIQKGENTWIVPTNSQNYLILASTLRIETYVSRTNRFRKYTIHDFCHLQSQGRIQKRTSIYVKLSGHLSANTQDFSCTYSNYPQ